MRTRHCPSCALKFKSQPRRHVTATGRTYGVHCPRCSIFVEVEEERVEQVVEHHGPRVPRDNPRWRR